MRTRELWGEGPWQNEPDYLQFKDEATGAPCLIVRGPVGALCGYVGVPEGHKYFGVEYDNVPVEVHGGLTYSNHCTDHICHVPEPGEPDHVWWLGFDCAHSEDMAPAIPVVCNGRYRYRDMDYVKREIRELAEQLYE